MAPTGRMIVNGHDLGTYDLWVNTPRGWADAPGRQDQSLDVQGAGEMLLPRRAKMRGRRWTVGFMMSAVSQASALAKWDALKLHLHNAWLEVMILPWTDRVSLCRYEGMEWSDGALEDKGFTGVMNFYSPSAYLIAPIVDSYSISPSAPAEFILGTAPSPFILEVIGPAVNPTFTYYDANGQVRGNFSVSGTLADREWLEINSQTGKMLRHTVAGAVQNGASFFGHGTVDFSLDPLDGVPERGPILAVDTGTAVLYTRRAFL